MGDQKTKSGAGRSTFSGSSGILTIIIFLWLAGLTALTVMFLKGSASTDLEERVVRLEAKASAVSRKVDPARGQQLAALESRLNNLEQRFGGGSPVTSAAATVPASGTDAADCDCGGLQDRIEKLETLVTAMVTDDGSKTVKVAATSDAPKETVTAEPKTTPRKAVAPKPKKTAKKRVAKKRSIAKAPASPPAYPGDDSDAYYTRYDPRYGGESVFDITQRIDPNYTRTENEQLGVRKLAPGAAVYPGSSTYLSE